MEDIWRTAANCEVAAKPTINLVRLAGSSGQHEQGRWISVKINLNLILDAKASLGEGPHWDHETKQLYFVDIEGKAVHVFHTVSHAHELHRFEKRVSSVIPATDDSLIVTLDDGIYRYYPHSGELEAIAHIEADMPDNRFNDAKCDPAGRLWAGTMSIGHAKDQGSLYRLERCSEPVRVVTGVGCSNGLAWDESKGCMYYIDTLKLGVDRFRYHSGTAEISGRETVIEWPPAEGYPDGMTIDNEGMLWIAHWGGGKVSRFDPDTGKRLAEIEVPALYVTSCVFGGERLDELYITTARVVLSEDEHALYPHAGGVFMAKPGVRGTPSRRFVL
ncbi:SMP-30/gluconolactonase/LRE family protein [Paenibacillus sp. 1011MAR3C5]|uniref:SMP-30/gluconolactonase/LRE family protein n=1 Tax=Paenibacillus sp. 1011MAR3C5 TaxID=1675787 RepID=UPI001601F624|nr:SMP-30/gluconolactonase/LRE family protein [Paenibacillus sp. 1011MAR3C5]